MFSVITGQVLKLILDLPQLQEVIIASDSGAEERAYNYPELYRRIQPGDRVRLNSAAVQLGLGTGGRHFVLPEYPKTLAGDFPGHIMKLRYTPWQMPVLAAEAEESPYHQRLEQAESLGGTPVVAASLHSMLPGIILGFRTTLGRPAKIVYVMTDGAALPIGFSNLVRELKGKNLLDLTVTAGNAFGGDLEAISLPSALLVAKAALDPDLIITALGPGIAGTGTKMGFSGIEQSWVLDLAVRLGGIPILAPRISGADLRPRHQGISHHTITVLQLLSNPVTAGISSHLSVGSQQKILARLQEAGLLDKNHWYQLDDPPAKGLFEQSGLAVSSMGRGITEDFDFFQSTVAAGSLAAAARSGNLNSLTEFGICQISK